MVDALIAAGADVNATTNEHWMALHMAVSKPGSLESDTTLDGIKVVKALLRAGAYVNAETGGFDVYMPLHLAIGAGSVEVVQILIDAGADVNAINGDGHTPLQEASGKQEIIDLLLAAGAVDTEGKYTVFVPERKCKDLPEGAKYCWLEISNQPGCWLLNGLNILGETVTWSGECKGGLAQGQGKEVFTTDEWQESSGTYVDGKRHGHWTEHYENGIVGRRAICRRQTTWPVDLAL